MNRTGIASFVVMLAAFTLAPAPASTDEFSDFRIPAHTVFSWTGSLNSSGLRNNGSGSGLTSAFSLLRGNLSTDGFWLSDSDPVFTIVTANGLFEGARIRDEAQAEFVQPTESIRRNHMTTETWSVSALHRRYPWRRPLGFELSASGSGAYAQSWSQNRTVTTGPPDQVFESEERGWDNLHSVSLQAAAGHGRVRNATGIFEAYVLEARLRESGALTRPLSAEAKRALAELMYVRSRYGDTRDRPAASIWREIERILTADGALAGEGLDPYSVMRAVEPVIRRASDFSRLGVPASPVLRLTGHFVSLQLSDTHQRRRLGARTGTTTTPVSEFELKTTSDFLLASLGAECHRPVGQRWQFDGWGTVRVPLQTDDVSMVFQGVAQAAFIVADRWVATGALVHTWIDDDRTKGPTSGDQVNWIAIAGVDYYLIDRLILQLTARESQSWRRGEPLSPPSTQTFARVGNVSLGITYRFAGGFHAANLFPVAAAGR